MPNPNNPVEPKENEKDEGTEKSTDEQVEEDGVAADDARTDSDVGPQSNP